MKKVLLLVLLIASFSLTLSGCIVTDNSDDYERKEFKSKETVSKVIVTDESTDVTFRIADGNELSVKYSDSPAEPWYDILISNGTLEIKKTESTVGVDNSLIISLPQKEYEEISVDTTNGDITFEQITASVYRCHTKNGNIKGTIWGNSNDYLCVVSVKNGDSTLENNAIESAKIIEFSVKNGDVKVELAQ